MPDGLAIDGLAGAALFYTHLFRSSGDPAHRTAALEAADRCGQVIAEIPLGAALYGGLAGFAWPLAHLQRLGLAGDAFDLDDIDTLLLECIDDTPHYDLISGTVGLGVYFLERLPAPTAVEGLRRVIERLRKTAIVDSAGARWFTRPDLVPPLQKDQLPAGKYDLGVAHGVPGVVAFLAAAIVDADAGEAAGELLSGAVKWLRSLERRDSRTGRFGTLVDPRDPHVPVGRRAAWCYGDPGIAVALQLGARALRDAELHSYAHGVARDAADLAEQERSHVLDMSLCHGSAGLAHVFSVLATAFADPDLRSSSGAWHRVTMDLRSPDEGIAGFYYSRWDDGVRTRVQDSSFLQGVTGVGLALLGEADATGDRSWDRLLLIS